VHVLQDKPIPDDVTILRIHGPFLFGATEKLTAQLARLDTFAPVVILRLRNMTAVDATGLRAIQDFADAVRKTGRTLIVCGAPPQPARMMERAEFHRHLGDENIQPSFEAALRRVEAIRRVPRAS
jgi:SulP family sulfate permease